MQATLPTHIDEHGWNEASRPNGYPIVRHTVPDESDLEDAGPWEPTVRQIIDMQHLCEDWDGLGANAPTPEVLCSAVGLAYYLRQRGVSPPSRVVQSTAGTVIMEWHFEDGSYGEVEVDRKLHAEVMLINPGQVAQHWEFPNE